MLKITIFDIPAEQRFVLEGKLSEPWLSEVESCWESAQVTRQGRRCVVDLREVFAIDRSGEDLLLRMSREGVDFIACGVSTRYRLEQLGIECRSAIEYQEDVVSTGRTTQKKIGGSL
jgi:hypothetical protein